MHSKDAFWHIQYFYAKSESFRGHLIGADCANVLKHTPLHVAMRGGAGLVICDCDLVNKITIVSATFNNFLSHGGFCVPPLTNPHFTKYLSIE